VALAIDASSPAVATNSSGAAATVQTASFTPPAGALLLIGWSGNSFGGENPAQPTITDSLGAPLTYTLLDWKSRADSPATDGQAAQWTAVVGSSAAMTVTVTSGTTNHGGNERASALKVWVLTGADTTGVGAHGKSGSASAGSIAQSYTAQATSGWGFITDCDWDEKGAQTAGTGCTSDGSANLGTAITYGFLRRTSADDVSGNSNTLNVTLPASSTNLLWVYVEVKPTATTTAAAWPGGPGPARIAPNGTWTPWIGTGGVSATVYTQSLAGTVTSSGALANQTSKALVGTVSSSGALAKLVTKAAAGTATSSGALAKLAVKAAAGAVASSGALTRQCQKALAGTVSPAGALAKLVAKPLAGTVTSSGALSTVKVLLRTFTGAVSSSGAMTRQVGKSLAGAVSPSGSLAKVAARALAGAVTAGGALAKLARKALAGTAAPSGTLTAQSAGTPQNATSTATVTATSTSTPAVTATSTSIGGVTARATSTPTVSDG
jgi:hypothetical protein